MRKNYLIWSLLIVSLFTVQAGKSIAADNYSAVLPGVASNATVNTSSYITIPGASLKSQITTLPFTFEMSFRPTAKNPYGTIWSDRSQTPICVLYYDNTNSYLRFDYGGTSSVVSSVGAVPVLNAWNHVAVTVTATSIKLTLNGVSWSKSGLTNTAIPFTGTSYIGCDYGGAVNRTITGQVDEIRIWNKSRTEDELNANKFKSLSGTEPGLVAYYNFDSQNTNDVTANAFNAAAPTDGLTYNNLTTDITNKSDSTLSGIAFNPIAGVLGADFSASTTSYTAYIAPNAAKSVVINGNPTAFAPVVSKTVDMTTSNPMATLNVSSPDGLHSKAYDFTFVETNMNQHWKGMGTTGLRSLPCYWGWQCNTSNVLWTAAGSGSSRYQDITTGYTELVNNVSQAWTGRLLYIRWDGVTSTAGVYSYPVRLQKGNSYNINFKLAWINNSTVPTYTVALADNIDGSNPVVSTSFVASSTKQQFKPGSLSVIPSESGVYYLTFKSSTACLGGVTDMALVDNGPVSYIQATPATLSFTPSARLKTIKVLAGAITEDIILTKSTSDYTLSKSTITVAEATADGGINIDITSIGTADGVDTITLKSGALIQKIPVSVSSSLTTGTRAFFCDQTTQDSLLLNISGDLYEDLSLNIPSGIVVTGLADNTSITSVSKAEVLAGKVLKLKWDRTTKLNASKIDISSGMKKDSVTVIAIPNNKIASWDADTITTGLSTLASAGWTTTDAAGNDLGVLSNVYNTNGGIRIVPILNAAHTYAGKPQLFGRSAYLRAWGTAAPFNFFNLETTLEAAKTYVFKGVIGWHNNGAAPNVTLAVNSAKSGLGTQLGSTTVNCPNKQEGKMAEFEFTTTTAGTYYLTVTCDQSGDAMISPDYLAIYKKVDDVTGISNSGENKLIVFVDKNRTLTVKNADTFSVFNAHGQLIKSINNAGKNGIQLIPGLYIVKSQNSATKVMVQ